MPKADLSLLQELVAELSKQLDTAYETREKIKGVQADEAYRQFVIELAKSVGLLSGITQEATLLVGDLQKIMHYASQKTSPEPEDILAEIFSKSKMHGGGDRN
jgi:hypothetical protein